ncbi:MAG: hypothetical protein K1W13_04465 [Lachnospiraceae bacterium]
MADIRSYTREKAKREQPKETKQRRFKLIKSESEETFLEKLKKHRLTTVYRLLLFALICGAIIALFMIQYKNKIYTDYDVTKSVGRVTVNGARDIRLGNSILTYSKDGAHCSDSAGNVLWDQTYEMQSPIVSICGGVTAIGDYNGRNIYIYNEEKQLGIITTSLPVRNLCVAANGVVAAVLEDTDVTWIYVYDTTGEVLVSFYTTMKNTGYPVSISLSPNALLCAVSYIYVDAGVVKSRVAFYNFDEYGQNQIDNLVGGYNHADTIVPYVQFMNNASIFAVCDDGIVFYGGSQIPEFRSVYYFDTEIRGVYHSENYVGVVFYNATGNTRYRMEIYNNAGEHVRTQEFDLDYTDILFDKDTYIIYNEEECLIMSMSGITKYNGNFKKAVGLLIPTNGNYRYTLATQDSVDTIQMK